MPSTDERFGLTLSGGNNLGAAYETSGDRNAALDAYDRAAKAGNVKARENARRLRQ